MGLDASTNEAHECGDVRERAVFAEAVEDATGDVVGVRALRAGSRVVEEPLIAGDDDRRPRPARAERRRQQIDVRERAWALIEERPVLAGREGSAELLREVTPRQRRGLSPLDLRQEEEERPA